MKIQTGGIASAELTIVANVL